MDILLVQVCLIIRLFSIRKLSTMMIYLKIEDVTARTSQASLTLMKVNAWIDALGKYSVDVKMELNGIS